MKKFKVASLFSGCGGTDLGFVKAGFDVVFANDISKFSCATYRQNIGDILHSDVTKIEIPDDLRADVLMGGFPCQPFSTAGLGLGEEDPRGKLYEQIFRFSKALKPKVIFLENVPGLLSRHKDLLDFIVSELSLMGYRVSYQLMNCSHYGVPQRRIRLFIVACLDGDPDLSIEETLKGLYSWTPNHKDVKQFRKPIDVCIPFVREGRHWSDIPDEYLPDHWLRLRRKIANGDVKNTSFFFRRRRDEIMSTVIAGFSPEMSSVIHPTENRGFSVREVARFQSFPDSFVFCGGSVPQMYKQVGNAIPPLIAKLFAERFASFLRGETLVLKVPPSHQSLLKRKSVD